MANKSGNAYGLTCLCPIMNGPEGDVDQDELQNHSYASWTRNRIQNLEVNEDSPFSRVPDTYLCRLYVLNDVFYEGRPAVYENLKSQYIVYSANFHGQLEPYLSGMWDAISSDIGTIWKYCVGFDRVNSAATWIKYIKDCQVKTTLFFNGSTDDSLEEQLKSLYLKQEFSDFVFDNQGRSPEEIQTAFKQFVERTRPAELKGPTWRPGASSLKDVVINE